MGQGAPSTKQRVVVVAEGDQLQVVLFAKWLSIAGLAGLEQGVVDREFGQLFVGHAVADGAADHG